jgi:hypothetical protein
MPTPAAHINEIFHTQEIVRFIERDYANAGSTGSAMYAYSDEAFPFFHSNQFGSKSPYEGTLSDISNSNSDKKFINLKKAFKTQFETLSEYFADVNFNVANEKLSLSLGGLLASNPDVISMELTHEQSAFFTIKKSDYTFFIQHFLNDIDEDDDEAILTVFKGNEKLPSYAGSLSQTISELFSVLEPVSTFKLHLSLNELSF